MKWHNYKKLEVWKDALDLTELIYELTLVFPTNERYNLTDQMKRASVSIPSNIAEGYGRGTKNEIIRFLKISNGSLNELDTQIHLAYRFEFMDRQIFQSITDKIDHLQRRINRLIQYNESKN